MSQPFLRREANRDRRVMFVCWRAAVTVMRLPSIQ
jgi:hypothetical protein